MGSLLEVRSNRIKSTLNQVIESLLGSKNFEIRVEYGAEKGILPNLFGQFYLIYGISIPMFYTKVNISLEKFIEFCSSNEAIINGHRSY